MENSILKGLKPLEFYKWFNEICKIPHGTKNEKKLIKFLADFAKERSIACEMDKKGNVFMNLPASSGYENQPAILFQAHLDMVCVKDENVDFDFENDAIKLKITGNKLHAQGTSLGADNAVGVATMLAIADSDVIAHPPLEFLFTVEEEIGLVGIKQFDFNKITARRMINMDCGDSHVLAVCSTGKRSGKIERVVETEAFEDGYCTIKIVVSGGKGGHASLSIRNGIACAVTCVGELLASVYNLPVKLCGLKTFGVALFKKAEAQVVLPVEKKDEVISLLNDCFAGIKTVYEKTNPDICLEIIDTVAPSKHLTQSETHKIVNLLGMIKSTSYRDDAQNNCSMTFTILNEVILTENKFKLGFNVRSFNEYDACALFGYYDRMSKILGFNVVLTDYYCAWSENINSAFKDKFVRAHKNTFGCKPVFERVQGGIETSIIVERIKDMDAIGVAPTARGAHTTDEYLLISEVPDFWSWLTAVLAEKE